MDIACSIIYHLYIHMFSQVFEQLNNGDKPLPFLRSLDVVALRKGMEGTSAFNDLLLKIRQLRTFLIDELPRFQLPSEQLNIIYWQCQKATIISSLKLLNIPGVEGHTVEDIVAKINLPLGDTSIYGSDGYDLSEATDTAILRGQLESPEDEIELLESLLAEDAIFLGVLSKGVIIAYGKLNRRLGYLVDHRRLSEEDAVRILNTRQAMISVRVLSAYEKDKPLPEIMEYKVDAPPYLLDFIADRLDSKNPVVFGYDELISGGATFRGIMQFLVDTYGERVVELVRFKSPGLEMVYVHNDQRENFLEGGDKPVFDETKYDFVWRLMAKMPKGYDDIRYFSIGFNKRDKEV